MGIPVIVLPYVNAALASRAPFQRHRDGSPVTWVLASRPVPAEVIDEVTAANAELNRRQGARPWRVV